jgi:hypothetical protein
MTGGGDAEKVPEANGVSDTYRFSTAHKEVAVHKNRLPPDG